ncbi:ArsR/SmtB family transcription factor [Lacticaseibacillus daqingensis]|uniref:ArsR/SmtB family transcription factor n=1 Tax=Lacticaseibacillus daqingensis TaxID=2486014 RepID=UPI000F7A90D6|nr:metalloregulator ArsR/SmtB family transcription factor [Lacticaseibacillus daqingensis]
MANFVALKQEFAACSDFLVALGDSKRQAIIIRLLEAEKVCDGLQVPDLTEATGLSRPAVSHHLKVLRDVKIVDYRSEGTKNYYFLAHDTEAVAQLQRLLADVATVMEEHNR